MAESLGEQGKFSEAIKILELELEHYPESSRAYFILGSIHEQAGDKDAAIDSLEKALVLAPDSQKPFFQQRLDRLNRP